jgi:ABC-type Fe3+/spermidine/putrescine transport system ATPase subunit
MRGEIRQLQQTLKITALYVTHDQEEALAISDRIAVMRAGRLEQVGAPAAIYNHPASPFVAEFMGTTNLLRGAVTGADGAWARVQVGGQDFLLGARGARPGVTITFSLRPESLRPVAPGAAPPAGWALLTARLERVEFLGALTRMDMQLADGTKLRVAALDLPPGWVRQVGTVELAYDPARITAFAAS